MLNIVYVYIGPLPDYSIDTVKQTRLFYNGPIYFIISDYESPYIKKLLSYDVTIIHYKDVRDYDFEKCVQNNIRKFNIVHELKDREKIFIYSFERFFVLYQLALSYNLSNILFLELDNLIYDDPRNWLPHFDNISYMYDADYRCASGICFMKTQDSLLELITYLKYYIEKVDGLYFNMTEMTALHFFFKEFPGKVQFLPTHWTSSSVPIETYINYDRFNSIFDAAGIGIYLGGYDTIHTNGIVITGLKSKWSDIDYTGYSFEWKEENGKMIPYICGDGDKWIRINNLHVHSKQLKILMS